MISTFNNNGVEIDYDRFIQFFPNVSNYSEIAKYLKKDDLINNNQKIVVSSISKNNDNTENINEETCDYIFIKGKDKENRCNSKAYNVINMVNGNPRCNKHLKQLSKGDNDVNKNKNN
jgi:hypothetical protein